jgi:hypothetical protein
MADKPPPKDLSDYIHPNSLEYKLKLGRVPPEPQEGIIWRGMSGGEYKNLLEQGFLESKGEYNIGETQKGLTIFSSRPRTAEMYAHDFAPKDFKAVPGSSAYVVGIRKPSGAVPQTQENPSEFGVRGQIPLKDIIKVYRGNVFRPKSDKSRAVLDWQEVPVSSLSEASAYSGFEKLPAVIDAASQLAQPPADDPRSKGKGRMFRGIGSLMRGRNILSLLQGLREGYELLPEEYQVLDEAWQYLKGTEFNPFDIDKPGIESFKELLGISPEDLGETIPLPGREPSKDASIPVTATDLEHEFWTDLIKPSGPYWGRTSELLEAVPSFSYKDRVVSVSREDLNALDKFLEEVVSSDGASSVPPRIRDGSQLTKGGKKWHRDLWDRSGADEPRPKAAGGFIDKPLYDDQRMIG